ncbi:MAG: M24 family metallopeptidase [Anaerolineae bacterium]
MDVQRMPTIPGSEYRRRWARVQRMMQAHQLDLVLAYADDRATFGAAHARWLANFPVHFEPVCILMPRQGDPVMLCGPESDQYARLVGQIPDVRVLREFTHPDEDYPYSKIQGLSQVLLDVLGNRVRVNKVGLAGQSLMGSALLTAFRETLDVQWVDVENAICDLRAIKSPAEIEVIRYAYQIAEQGLLAALDAIHVGVSERAVAAEAEAAMRRAGAEGTGIDTIVASGPNSRPILARSTWRRIQADELVLLTVAPRYEGYHGAIGRPVFVGNPGDEIRRAADVARRAQQACFEAMHPGVEGRRVEAAGRQVVQEAGLGSYFLYSGLHSVGVIEFEPPIFGPSSEARLAKDMILSVDIPIFNAPWGGLRVEDGFLVTEAGAERLNETPYWLQR